VAFGQPGRMPIMAIRATIMRAEITIRFSFTRFPCGWRDTIESNSPNVKSLQNQSSGSWF
jgi:hypothetical protein